MSADLTVPDGVVFFFDGHANGVGLCRFPRFRASEKRGVRKRRGPARKGRPFLYFDPADILIPPPPGELTLGVMAGSPGVPLRLFHGLWINSIVKIMQRNCLLLSLR